MAFEERIRKIVVDGVQHVEDERRLDAEFNREWGEVRRMVWTVLSLAAKAASEDLGGTKPDQTNGCTVLKSTAWNVTAELRFCPDDATRQVVCSVKPADLISEGEGFPESFTLDALTQAVVEEKTAAFFEAIFRRATEKRRPGQRRSGGYVYPG